MNSDSQFLATLIVFLPVIFCALVALVEFIGVRLYDRHLDKVFALIDSRILTRQSFPKAFSLNVLAADYSCNPE